MLTAEAKTTPSRSQPASYAEKTDFYPRARYDYFTARSLVQKGQLHPGTGVAAHVPKGLN